MTGRDLARDFDTNGAFVEEELEDGALAFTVKVEGKEEDVDDGTAEEANSCFTGTKGNKEDDDEDEEEEGGI